MSRVVISVVVAGVALAGGGFLVLRSARDRASELVAPRPPAPNERAASAPTTPPRAAAALVTPRTARREAAAPALAPTSAAPAAPRTATLRITSDIPGAQVFLNREFVGATPVTANDVKPGAHQLNVAAQGFDNHVETLEIEPGERDIVIKFREVRLNATLDVIHKHRMGSCQGRLIATPQGLRYETTDKDDAFDAALLDLETFQVDYLNKNLRVQPREGKRYDFSDPQGSADNLFVFHRDVERVRERLKKTG